MNAALSKAAHRLKGNSEVVLVYGAGWRQNQLENSNGAGYDFARRAFRDSFDFYLEGCARDGEEPERPFSRSSS